MRQRIIVLLALATVGLVAAPARADHGSWSHHHIHWGTPNVSQYSAYGDLSATDKYDFGYIRTIIERDSGTTVADDAVTCQASNESCTFRKSPTRYWVVTPTQIDAIMCAKDGGHELSGYNSMTPPCNWEGIPLHQHQVNL